MRQGQQNRRNRGRSRKSQNPLTRSYESNGPDVKIRGTPSHIAEKYVSLARDALASGDPVLAENYLQHAEHYNRIIMSVRDQQVGQGGDQMNGMNRVRVATLGEPFDGSDEYGDDEGDESGLEVGGQGQPSVRPGDPQPHVGGSQSQPRFDERGGGERSERPERADRQDRHERYDRFDRNERGDRDRNDRQHRHDRSSAGRSHEHHRGNRKDRHHGGDYKSFGGDRNDRGDRDRDRDRYSSERSSERSYEPRGFERERPSEDRQSTPQPPVEAVSEAPARAESQSRGETAQRPERPERGEGGSPRRREDRERREDRRDDKRDDRFSAQPSEQQPEFLRRPVRRPRRETAVEAEATSAVTSSATDETRGD